MDARETNGPRTHEPNLRELTSEMDGMREVFRVEIKALRELIDERHSLYSERDHSRQDAVHSAFLSSEKSNTKTEEAQKAYNAQHNDLINKMDKQNAATMPRIEIESRFVALEEKIGTVRDNTSAIVNRGVGMDKMWGYIVAAAGSGGVAAFFLDKLLTK